MNSVTAVLLALVLIVVILLIVWLVLRSRSSDLPQESVTHTSGADSPEAASAGDRMPHEGHENTRDEDVDLVVEPSTDADVAAAEEYVDPGLSEMDAQTPDKDADGVLSGTPPRTPTEAFGSAEASGDAAAHEAASLETSVLDDPTADSTPLFRSIREELLGSAASEELDEDVDAGSAETTLPDEVIAERPEVDPGWSEERRSWDEQAHAETADAPEGSPDLHADAASIEAQENVWSETVTEGVVETGAVGAGSVGPEAEEEELLETNEETAEEVVETDSVAPSGEHPPTRRISELQEVVDGGFGIGSAATIADGAQPLGHPIKANVDTKTYQDLHSHRYDETEPDVWFLDVGFAERAGFHRAD